MATAYDMIEDGIQSALEAEGSLFNKVLTHGACMSDDEVAIALERLAPEAPVALVFYAGGTTNNGENGELVENATFAVVVLAAGSTVAAASRGDKARAGVYQLMQHVRERLHNVPEIEGIINPLTLSANRRFRLPDRSMTVAAWMCEFSGRVLFADGPT